MQTVPSVPVLVLTGPVGVGKSTVASEAARMLREAHVSYALVDLPRIGEVWPPAADDPWNERVIHSNLASMWSNFRAAGASRLLLCRVLECRSLLRYIADAVPDSDIVVVRLRAPWELVRERLIARESPRSADWYLNVASYLVAKMDESRVEDHLVNNDHRLPREVAKEVLRCVGWL